MNATKGPWAIRDDDEDGVVSIVGGSGIVLARVRTATAEPGDENAILIAAAPELLAACNEAIECGEDGDWQSARRVLAAAIAKATGEQP